MRRRAPVVCALSALSLLACGRVVWPGPKDTPSTVHASPGDPRLATARVPENRAPPRILLTRGRLSTLAVLREVDAPSWATVSAECDRATREKVPAGYEAWDWANAALSLGICWRVTGRADYADAGVGYLVAMLDDRAVVGDGKGGDLLVRHDDGYPIRTRGCFAAIAYDWLRDAAAMTPAVRKKAADRFVAFTTWFSKEGYNRDEPIANYYAGYFGAVAFGGLALEGDDARAAALRAQADRMWAKEIVPAFDQKLAGGDFPEGWQYGDMTAAILAIYADATGRTSELAWLRDTVAYHAHALLPDGKHVYDSGDWSTKPATATPHALFALAVTLPPTDAAAMGARALSRLAAEPSHEEWKWLELLADDPTRPSADPRAGRASYLARGTGTVFARTAWSPDAVWLSFASAPTLSDHQHLDAGHFEIVRGADALVVDGGGYASYATLSHNAIAIDDGRENLPYAPNQGRWSGAAKIARFEDAGAVVYALADYASAYDPPGYPTEHPARSVARAEREVVFSRAPVVGLGPASTRVVVFDRVTVTKATYGTTFLLHGGAAPEVRGAGARIVVGRSAAWMTTLVPRNVTPSIVAEPTNLGDSPWFVNDPPEGVRGVRLEVASPRGDVERRFLHAFVVGPSAADAGAVPAAVAIDGEASTGVAIGDEAYVFAREPRATEPIAYRAPNGARRHVVASLTPGAAYAVTLAREGALCAVRVTPGGGARASTAGLLVVDARTCAGP